MNYPENKRTWERGDIVIHDADAKEHRMLMRVITPNRCNGHCITEYVYPGWVYRTQTPKGRYQNGMKSLHDPRRFGLIVPNENEPPFIVEIFDSTIKVETSNDGNIAEVVSKLRLSNGDSRPLRGWGDLICKFYDEHGFQFMPSPEDIS